MSEMTQWAREQLHAIDITDEVEVASLGPDGAQRRPVTIQAVTVADAVYIRSARGPQSSWFTGARTSGVGRFTVGSLQRGVTYEVVDPERAALHTQLVAAYHAKYDHDGPRIVGSVVGPIAAQATLLVTPTS